MHGLAAKEGALYEKQCTIEGSGMIGEAARRLF